MAKFTIEIDMDSAAFDLYPQVELRRCCEKAIDFFSDVVGDGSDRDQLRSLSNKIHDINGNTIGTWRYEE